MAIYNIDFCSIIKLSNDKYKTYIRNNWFNDLYKRNILSFEEIYNCDNNSLNVSNTQVNLCKIFQRGASVWLSTTGELKYRLTINGEIKTTTVRKATIVLSSYCKISLNFVKEASNNKKRDNKVSIFDLMIIEGEKFDPSQPKEFFTLQTSEEKNILDFFPIQHNRDIFYINSFKPSKYLCINIQEDKDKEKINIKSSVILHYIYYLANYKQERFEYILTWIASFFQNLKNKSQVALVLVGCKTSGVELLFKNIIIPLFGEKYCSKIFDHNLDIKNQSLLVENKIFYNLNNLSHGVIENKKNKNFIDSLLIDKNMQIEISQQKIKEIPLYGQILITSYNDISYLDSTKHNYKIFKVPENINKIYLNNSLQKVEKSILEDWINKDLNNFAYILKLYLSKVSQDIEDDRSEFNISLEEKIANFHYQIMNYSNQKLIEIKKINETLYKELNKDFQEHIIKQVNIFKYFKVLYPEVEMESSRTLMVYLRKQYDEFYNVKELKNGKNGLKYFLIK